MLAESGQGLFAVRPFFRKWRIEVAVFVMILMHNTKAVHVSWNLMKPPVSFGNSAELSCYIKDHQYNCTRSVRQWLGGATYVSLCQNMYCRNNSKYHVYTTDPCNYRLMIYNISIHDVNCDYTCLYGGNYQRKSLNMDTFKYIPKEKEIQKVVTMHQETITVNITIQRVFPVPECSFWLMGKNVTSSLNTAALQWGYFYETQISVKLNNVQCNDGKTSLQCDISGTIIEILNHTDYHCPDTSIKQETTLDGKIIIIIISIISIISIFATISSAGLIIRRRRRLGQRKRDEPREHQMHLMMM